MWCFISTHNKFEYKECLSRETCLSTFVSFRGDSGMSIQELISNFKFLRVLSLSSCQNIKVVPDGIGNLIHLRSVDLSNTHIETLPDSMCLLCNLLVLKLNYCLNLEELPSTLHELTNLRCLELLGTTLRKAPVLLGKLKNLQVWMNEFEFSIRHLGELDLHGELSIQNIENIVNLCDTFAADLKNKTHLVRLRLEWNFKRSNDDSIKVREVLESLQPPKHLKYLSIDGYSGTKFPSWLSDNSLSNMVCLTLQRCRYCPWLPSLGLLTVLEYLKIDGLDWIQRIDADFYGNSSSSFPSLETLIFTHMKYWEEWQFLTGAFRNLRSLYVKDCPKLKGHFLEQLSHLKKLTIENCKQLGASIPSAVEIEGVKMEPSSLPIVSHTPLEYLIIGFCPDINIPINHCPFLLELRISYSCDSLTTFSLDLFPKLRHLTLHHCYNLEMISQEHPHSHLKILEIIECSELKSFSNEGLFAPQLETFEIRGLKKWKSMPKHMSALLPSLHRLLIIDCPGVELSEECFPSNIKEIYLWNCSKVVGSLKGVWGTNPSLKFLRITNPSLLYSNNSFSFDNHLND